MKKLILFIMGSLLMIPVYFGCEKTEDTPPKLPPYESMMVDFSKFKVQTKSASDMDDPGFIKGYQTSANWQFAAGTVLFWNTLLTVTLAIPVTSFYASFNQKPEYLGKAKWEWKYDVSTLSGTYSARLTGEIRSSDIKWEMNLSKSGDNGFPEFKWFEGTSKLDGSGGQWILYHSNIYQEQVLQIDWEKSGQTVGQVQYTYVRSLNDNRVTDLFNGSYLIFGLQSNYFDAYYTVHSYNFNSQQFNDTYIEWSTTLYYGHVKAYHRFQDNNWHCWDNHGVDITCTQ